MSDRANRAPDLDVGAFLHELQQRPEDLRAFAQELRQRPEDLRTFEQDVRKDPDDLEALKDAIRKGVSRESIRVRQDSSRTPIPPGTAPSVLGTDVSRFHLTTRRNRYEEEQMRLVLAMALAPDSNAIDVGAHGGTVLREILRLAPQGSHLAFEPLPAEAQRLVKLFPEVDVRQVALADSEGETTFVHVTSLTSWSGLRQRDYPSSVTDDDLAEMRVRVERLDQSLPQGYVPELIKVDVEGAEEWVLRGALATLQNHRPVVIFEHSMSASAIYGTTSSSLHHLLCQEAGLRIFDLAGDGPYTVDEFEESQFQLRWVNYIARP